LEVNHWPDLIYSMTFNMPCS